MPRLSPRVAVAPCGTGSLTLSSRAYLLAERPRSCACTHTSCQHSFSTVAALVAAPARASRLRNACPRSF
eukprot:1441146-Alexandrium_andersonii.AAC.1